MKRITAGLMAALMLLPGISFAQTTAAQTAPQAPASWVAFQQQENTKRIAFYKQLNDERKAFLKANPDVKAYLDQMRVLARARAKAWKAAHQPKTATAVPAN
jgi:hypothetical protein